MKKAVSGYFKHLTPNCFLLNYFVITPFQKYM